MNKAIGTGSIDRGARVRRIKRVLILLIVALIIMPSVLCGCLFVKLNKLEKQMDELSVIREKHTVITENTTIVEAKEAEPSVPAALYATVTKKAENDNAGEDEIVDKNEGLADDSDEIAATETVDGSIQEDDEVVNDERNDIKLKKVYLTFDDGPSYHTDKILDILNEYDAKATFFVNGKNADGLDVMYKRIVDEGHKIGMHSYTHIYKEVYANKDAFTYDLDRIQAFIYEKTGVLSDIYRFPGGSSNTVSNISMSVFADVLNDRGIRYYDWNVVSGDTQTTYGLPADVIVNKVISGAVNQEEAIVLFHDLPEKKTTVEALPRILEYFKSHGVEMLPITEDTYEYHQPFAK